MATAAAIQVDVCIPNFIIQEFFPYRSPDFYRLVHEDFDTKAVDGYLDVPTAPGLGVVVNDEVLAQYDSVRIL